MEQSVEALSGFTGVRRRQEVRGEVNGIRVIDDFAHHPTAIRMTLEGLRAALPDGRRLLVVLEPRSNTMRMGVHAESLGGALAWADQVFLFVPDALGWSPASIAAQLGDRLTADAEIPGLVAAVTASARPGDSIVIMSNGGFGGIHESLLESLREKWHGSL
jgi:UDP-N-acetylmuramate: L-alanyl-gamma-D-glutamyl-meso-diaminopimelate ligase